MRESHFTTVQVFDPQDATFWQLSPNSSSESSKPAVEVLSLDVDVGNLVESEYLGRPAGDVSRKLPPS